jgi:S1-C subfamily serine protease
MAFAVAFVGVAHGSTQPLLVAEGERLASSGRGWTSEIAYLLAGERGDAARTPTSQPTAVAADKTAKPEPLAPAQLRAGDGKERTPAQIFNEFAPSVVTITVKGALGEGGGTGFVIDAGGTIGTNYHVIEHAEDIEVKLMDGTVLETVEVLVSNEAQDLALLHVKAGKPLPPVVLGDSDKITVGERAVSIGNPLGLDHTLTDGLVSARRVISGRKMIQMSTPVSPGNSGGPLFNSRGEVIGVSTAIYAGGSPLAQNLNLAMPINDLKAMIKRDYPGRHKPGAGITTERW